ncbi:Hypothetical predicted protein [Mytilus galloprovincialis]|uniref:Macroglobulin domain-containing protein n=1 Tax=Mytilus galloprovincialis TaxID=29158 RepID=A0A8B6F767_MYTGA|nr:Hypothetical predicted protein [Mytilus galloprovincialis]
MVTVPKTIRIGIDIDVAITVFMRLPEKLNIVTLFKTSSLKTIAGASRSFRGKPVQFRVFGLKPSLKVIQHPLDVVIFDTLGNRVKQYLKVTDDYGVFGGFLQLSSVTKLGDWRIQVSQSGSKETKTFAVEEYELPKFEVKVSLLNPPLKEDNNFVIRVTAIYTFGKPVEGIAVIQIKSSSSWVKDIYLEKNIKIHGKVDVRISTWDLYPQFGEYYRIFAKVNETVTGKDANDTEDFHFESDPWQARFSPGIPSTFKPGLTYTIIVKIEKSDGSRIKHTKEKAKLILSYDYSIIENKRTRTEKKVFFNKDVSINKNGAIIQQVSFPAIANSGRIYASISTLALY